MTPEESEEFWREHGLRMQSPAMRVNRSTTGGIRFEMCVDEQAVPDDSGA
jgi:hypothetical protein